MNRRNNLGWTPLQLACRNGHLGAVMALIAVGANVNEPGFDGWTALHTAAFQRRFGCQTLLSRGAELNARENRWLTPLHVAGYSERVTCVRALIAAGADVTLADTSGRTPYHAAGLHIRFAKWLRALHAADAGCVFHPV